MSAWRKFADQEPPPGYTPYLLLGPGEPLPRVGMRAPQVRITQDHTVPSGGWHVSFPPLQGGEPRMRGVFVADEALVDWSWAPIPE